LDQETIENHPISILRGLLEHGADITGESQGAKNADRDFLKLSVFGRDGLERRGDPFDFQRFGPENHIPEFCCL